MMYRSTPHSTTGVSPAELLFGRQIRTKLPQLREFSIEDEARDRDNERKEKGKVYVDRKRNARESEILEGDKMILREEKENKLSTPLKQSPFTVVQENGNSVLVEVEGVQYYRNVIHVKKYFEPDGDVSSKSSDCTESERVPHGSSGDTTMGQGDSTTSCPSVQRLPTRFQDYALGCVQLDLK